MLLQDVEKEIRETAKSLASTGDAAERPKQEKPKKTKAEIEAYRQKKMAEEESKYLKGQGKATVGKKSRAATERRNRSATKKEAGATSKAEPTPKKRMDAARAPVAKVSLHDIQPLHMLHIPGLPSGAYLLVSLVTPK